MENLIIVGSGPAAMAAALASTEAMVVDTGLGLEPDIASRAASLGQMDHQAWPAQDVSWLQSSMVPSSGGVAAKLYFGSDVAYQNRPQETLWNIQSGYQPSLAFGGLSTVWGASVLPPWHREISDWPFPQGAWDIHFRTVLKETGLAGVRDSLDEILPLYHADPEFLAESSQARSIRERMERNRETLIQGGFRWGRSRLLVRAGERGGETNRLSYHPAQPPSYAQNCVQCGMCMYGCPYDLIYSSRKSILNWMREGRIRYQSGIEVEGFREWPDRVEVWGKHMEDGQGWRRETQRLFLAAGTLASTALVLGAPGTPTKSARLLDSQYFTVPLLLFRSTPRVRSESLHALAQLFLEILPGPVSSRLIHLQIYTYNDMIHRLVEQKLGPLRNAWGALSEKAEGRLAFLQGYLHSDDSGTMEMSLDPEAGRVRRISVVPRPNPRSRQVIRLALGRLCRHSFRMGFIPLWPMLQVGLPGRGFHSGGSLPMCAQPRGEKSFSDLLGRPYGLKRVHVVDSSVFPTIPATTITLMAMANAHRIAAEAARLQP